MKRNIRGFREYSKFKDKHGQNIFLTESSDINHCAWLCIDDGKTGEIDELTGERFIPAAYLSTREAKILIRALQKFIDEV